MSLLMSMMGAGGALPIPRIPCALCVAEDGAPDAEQAATLVAGTLVCAEHAGRLLADLDRGHIAASVRDVAAAVADVVDRLDQLALRR